MLRSPLRPVDSRHWLVLITAAGALLATAVLTADQLIGLARSGGPVTPWRASQFYVTYTDGLIRRGLPGEVLAVIVGGAPSSGLVTAVAITLTCAAALTVGLLLAWLLHAHRAGTGVLVAAIVLSSPFTLSLLVRDLGRYDAAGFIAAAAVAALWRPTHLPRWLPAAGTGVVVLAAVATEEFLVAFLVPLSIVAALSQGHRLGPVLAALVPAGVIAVASLAARPTPAYIAEALGNAQGQGVAVDETGENAINALGQSAADAAGRVQAASLQGIVVWLVVLGGIYLASAALLWLLADRPVPELYWGLVGVCGTAAVVLCVVGVDFRRWFALAFVTVLASFGVLPGSSVSPRLPGWAVAASAVVLAASVATQAMGIFPS